MIRASDQRHLAGGQFTIQKGVELASRDAFGEIGLHQAAKNGHVETTEVSLQHGVDKERIRLLQANILDQLPAAKPCAAQASHRCSL